mgnify:CR=1 FL=1
MSEHEDTGLVIALKAESKRAKNVGLCPFGFAAHRLEALHAQRADLLERLDQSEQREHHLRVELIRARHEFLVVISRATTARNYIETTINTNKAERISDATNWPV